MKLPSIVQFLPYIQRNARRNQEKELAKVLIGIVILFICCHTLRVITDFYEMVNIKHILRCNNAGKVGVSSWIIPLNNFSKLMIATNSSVSMVVYCLTNIRFRKKMFGSNSTKSSGRGTTNNKRSRNTLGDNYAL